MTSQLPWWKSLFELRHAEGCWEESEFLTERDVVLLSDLLGTCRDHKILDLGCGKGRHAIGLARKGFCVHGIDISPVLIEEAKKRIPPDLTELVSFEVGDMLNLQYQAEFGAVILMDVSFGFFEDQDNLRVLQNVAAALRDGGVLVLELFNVPYLTRMEGRDWFQAGELFVLRETRLNLKEATIEFSGSSIRIPTGVLSVHPVQKIRFYTFPEIRRMLLQCGFEIIDVFGNKPEGVHSDRQLLSSSLFMEILARKKEKGT